jgi:hypothetical protein
MSTADSAAASIEITANNSKSVRILKTDPVTTPANEWNIVAYSKILAPGRRISQHAIPNV